MNPLKGLTLFSREESVNGSQPLTLSDDTRVLLIQGYSHTGKTLLARRVAGQAYADGCDVRVVSDKAPWGHEYSGERLMEIPQAGMSIGDALRRLSPTDEHVPTLFVFDALDLLLTDDMSEGFRPRSGRIKAFSSFMEKVSDSSDFAVIATTQWLIVLNRLSNERSLDIMVTDPSFPDNAPYDYRASVMNEADDNRIYTPKYSGKLYQSFDVEYPR